MVSSQFQRLTDRAAKEARRAAGDIGKPCSHYSGCGRASTTAVGWWYPNVGGDVFCDGHAEAVKGRGDTVLRA